MALEAVGILATTLLLSTTVTGSALVIPLFVYGIGVGLATAQLTSVTLSDIPMQKSGLASGANSTMRQVGSALGIAILGTILIVSLGNGVRTKLADVPGPAAGGRRGHRDRHGIVGGPGAHRAPGQSPARRRSCRSSTQAFVEAARLTGFAAFAVRAAGPRVQRPAAGDASGRAAHAGSLGARCPGRDLTPRDAETSARA